MLEAVFRDDLKGFQQSANQFKQDVLDARQLSYETDRVIDRLRREGAPVAQIVIETNHGFHGLTRMRGRGAVGAN